MKTFLLTNGDGTTQAVVVAKDEKNAIELLKDQFDFETNKSFQEFNPDNEFADETEFNEWNCYEFYSKFPVIECEEIPNKKEYVILFDNY